MQLVILLHQKVKLIIDVLLLSCFAASVQHPGKCASVTWLTAFTGVGRLHSVYLQIQQTVSEHWPSFYVSCIQYYFKALQPFLPHCFYCCPERANAVCLEMKRKAMCTHAFYQFQSTTCMFSFSSSGRQTAADLTFNPLLPPHTPSYLPQNAVMTDKSLLPVKVPTRACMDTQASDSHPRN